MSKPRFVISSPFNTFSGYGARARDVIKSIIELDKYEVQLLPQRWGHTSWGFCEEHPEWEFLLKYVAPQTWNQSKPDIWMQITIPNEFQPVGKYNIGCTAGIEATLCKIEWIEGLNRMDMNWVSSNFAKEVFTSFRAQKTDPQTKQVVEEIQLQKPIEVVFEGANLDIYKPLNSSDIEVINLDQIKEEFCYLFVGHWMQGEFGHDRKNVGLLVKSFLETFKNKAKKPALILKASNGVASYMSREAILDKILKIKKSVNTKNLPNIYLLNGEFNDKEVNELYNHPKVKAMVSLTKGEGFGRPLLEFSLTNKPIMVSNWSGHVDFLNPEFVSLIPGTLENVHPSVANDWLIQEAQWFKPDAGHVGHYFKEIFENYKEYKVKGKRQGYHARTNFSFDKMKELVGEILDKNIPEFPKQVELNMPKLNLPKLQKLS